MKHITLKYALKSNRKLFNLYRILMAALRTRIDISALREACYLINGYVDLGPGNRKFYENILPRIMPPNTTILDVGANDGWFAKTVFRFCGDKAHVISFEPLRSAYQKLLEVEKRFPNFHPINVALGADPCITSIKEYGTSGLSSIKGINNAYSYDPCHYDTHLVDEYPVEVCKLDDWLIEKHMGGPFLLKIDTQGFEMEVLEGAQKTILSGQVYAVIVEAMTVQKYSNATLYQDLFSWLHGHGFTLFDIYPAYYEGNGQMSEFDCAFKKA